MNNASMLNQLLIIGLCVFTVSCQQETSPSILGVPASTEQPIEEEDSEISEDAEDEPTQTLPTGLGLDSKESSQLFYETNYLPTESTLGNTWQGYDVNTCAPGYVNAEEMDAAVMRLNYYRALVGVGVARLDATLTEQAQAAALTAQIQFDLGELLSPTFHNPVAAATGELLDWPCLNLDAYAGLNNGNIAQHSTTHNAATAVGFYIWDFGASNASAGHRESLFRSNLSGIGLGATRQANVLVTQYEDEPEGMWTWPPKDVYVPINVMQNPTWGFPRWSIRNENAWLRWKSKVQNGGVVPRVSVTDCNGFDVPVSEITIADNKMLTWKTHIEVDAIVDECRIRVDIADYYSTDDEDKGAAEGVLKTLSFESVLFKASVVGD